MFISCTSIVGVGNVKVAIPIVKPANVHVEQGGCSLNPPRFTEGSVGTEVGLDDIGDERLR